MADYDVVIIGAGAAGLAAASGWRVGRSGGAYRGARPYRWARLHHLPAGATLPIELGADFVHGRPSETFAIAAEAGLRL